MNEDDLESAVLRIADWIDANRGSIYEKTMETDYLYEGLTDIVFEELEKFCTRERNYN